MTQAQNQLSQQDVQKLVITKTLNTVDQMRETGLIKVPKGYYPESAILSARFKLLDVIQSGSNKGRTLFEVCSKESIQEALVTMVQYGLDPAKNQCYFIPYGDRCVLMPSYHGKVLQARRADERIQDVLGFVVYEGEDFTLEFDHIRGRMHVKDYKPDITKWSVDKIVGAVGLIVDKDDKVLHTEFMTLPMLKAAWGMGATNGNSPAHNKFPDQMAIKTVKNRAVKSYIGSADDSQFEDVSVEETDARFIQEVQESANALEFKEPIKALEQKAKNEEEVVKVIEINDEDEEDKQQREADGPLEGFFDESFVPLTFDEDTEVVRTRPTKRGKAPF